VINLIGLVILIGSGALFFWLLQLVRPALSVDALQLSLKTVDLDGFLFLLLNFLGINLLVIILHEAVHGLCFWLFTGRRPKFGFRGFYAFAAAPNWYLPKGLYLVVGLAPLVLLTILGWAALLITPVPWILPILLFVILNFAGAVGDMYTVIWLLRKRERVFVRDFGNRMCIYGLIEAQGIIQQAGGNENKISGQDYF